MASNKEYLKRYVSGPEKKKTKKQKAKSEVKRTGFKIIDDDIDVRTTHNVEDIVVIETAEDKPVVVDTDGKQLKELEWKNNSKLWKKLEHIDGKSDKCNRQIGRQDSDNSPQRSEIDSPSRKRQRADSDSDYSPPKNQRLQRKDSESDNSPPRNRRLQRADSESDNSPPRNRRLQRADSESDNSPPRNRRLQRADSDNSPPRQRIRSGNSDSDISPPRKKHRESDSDCSPPRSTQRNNYKDGKQRNSDSAKSRRTEVQKSPVRKQELVTYRKDGKKRDLDKEQKAREEEDAKRNALAAKYKDWNRGIKQKEMVQEMTADALHEIVKPLARYKDDKDLDTRLRDQEREEDPMLAFIKKKKSSDTGEERKRYRGPQPPPNRFNIEPGYRWDGVNRSNGFELKFFSKLSDDKARKDIAHKWSVEDM